jgi:hypothetical protein
MTLEAETAYDVAVAGGIAPRPDLRTSRLDSVLEPLPAGLRRVCSDRYLLHEPRTSRPGPRAGTTEPTKETRCCPIWACRWVWGALSPVVRPYPPQDHERRSMCESIGSQCLQRPRTSGRSGRDRSHRGGGHRSWRVAHERSSPLVPSVGRGICCCESRRGPAPRSGKRATRSGGRRDGAGEAGSRCGAYGGCRRIARPGWGQVERVHCPEVLRGQLSAD